MEARNAFREALKNYQEALTFTELLTKSPSRDLLELELRQSVVSMLQITGGYSNPKTIDATEEAVALAEKSGNLQRLVSLTISRCMSVLGSGNLPLTIALADQAVNLALRGGTHGDLAFTHTIQIMARYRCGDLAGVERHFADGLEFFGDPDFRQVPGMAVAAFGVGSYNAWTLGRAELASERQSQMMRIAETPYDVAMSAQVAAQLLIY